jgi:hypothetical protein
MREAVLEAGLECVERGVAVILAAGIDVDARELRVRAQCLLQLQVGRIALRTAA